ncbi:MAG: CbbQ/NirQ/NorQ/GpvN family protein [Planctomycetota bacterium]
MTPTTFAQQFRVDPAPVYIPQGDEAAVFRAAHAARVPLSIKGPTGCGKTRFVAAMAHALGLPLVTVSCHEDLTAADLVGRFLFVDNQTVWHDGPLTLAVRYGGICYLDEIVEARKDTTVVIHSLTDDRRTLYLDATGEVIRAHDDFMVVLSYNPGYQSIVKDLKPSTRQRFAGLDFNHPDRATEAAIIERESGVVTDVAERLATIGEQLRALHGYGLDDCASTRLLVHAARLIAGGLPPLPACEAALTSSLTDAADSARAVRDIIALHFGDLAPAQDGEKA